MHKPLTVLFVLLVASTQLFAQDILKGFDLLPSSHKVSNSLYNRIRYMDSRTDDTTIGVIGVGLLRNTPVKLVFARSFAEQLEGLLNVLTDATAKNGELLFQLERFHFIETYGTRSCYLQADLYAAADGRYKRIGTLDTVVLIRAGDIKAAIIENASRVISEFIAYNLFNAGASSETYSFDEVAHIDSLEMQKMPVYISENYVDGLYLSYESFVKQKPDGQGAVHADREGNISTIKTLHNIGKQTTIYPKDLYAVVYNGVPFVATDYGYYKLQKTANNSFLFTGDVKTAGNSGDASNGQPSFGVLGAPSSPGTQETYVVLINYRNGAFIHLKKVDNANQ